MANPFSLEGKNAWITGASYGIGFNIAKAFVAAGIKTIIFNDINEAALERGLNNYKEAGIENVKGYVCDVTDENDGKRPQLSDLRESGAIEQDADMVIFVHRPEYYRIYHDENGTDLRGLAQIIIAKHRKGAVGDVLLRFLGQYTRFANPDEGYVPPTAGGEIIGSKMNDPMPDDPLGPPPPPDSPF